MLARSGQKFSHVSMFIKTVHPWMPTWSQRPQSSHRMTGETSRPGAMHGYIICRRPSLPGSWERGYTGLVKSSPGIPSSGTHAVIKTISCLPSCEIHARRAPYLRLTEIQSGRDKASYIKFPFLRVNMFNLQFSFYLSKSTVNFIRYLQN